MEFMLDVNGKDLIVRVTAFKPETVCMRRGHPDTWWPDEDWEAEWVLIGEDGYELNWELTKEEEAQIESEVFFAMMCEIEDSKAHEYEKSMGWDD